MQLSPQLLLFPPGLALLGYLSLVGLVLYRGARSRQRTFFILFLLCMAVWSLGSMMMRLDPEHIELWNKVLMTGGTVTMPLALFAFVQTFLGHRRDRWLWVGLGVALALSITTAAGYMVDYVRLTSDGHIEFGLGPALPVQGVYWAFLLGFSFVNLLRAYHHTVDPIRRNRIRYLLIAMGFILLGGVTNASSALSAFPIDHIANMISAGLITYAVLRYRLLDISLVIRKGLLYSIPTAIIGTTYFLIISLVMNLFGAVTDLQVFLLSFGVAVVAAVLAQPVRDRAQEWVDRLFFREKYDSGLMLQRLGTAASSILDLARLTGLILDEVTETMHVKSAAFFVKQEEDEDFHIVTYKGMELVVDLRFGKEHPLVEWLSRHETSLLWDDMDLVPQFKALWGREREDLERMGAELFLPLKAQDELVGIFAVGPKLSEQPYSQDEQLTLTTLATQVAMAIENARLYGVVQQELDERRRAEEALRALSARYEAILGAVPDIIMEVDSNQVYVWANQAGEDFFGDDVLGKEAAYYFEGAQDTHEKVEPLFVGEDEEVYVESWQRRRDGERRLLAWWSRGLKDEDGKVRGALSAARDITDRNRLEEQLRQTSKMEAVGQLAGGVAHDFNNLLTVINGYSDFVLESLDVDSPFYGDLQEVRQAGERAAVLTRQLLAFSRQQTLEMRVLDVNETLQDMAKMLQRIIGEDVTLRLNLAEDLGRVMADPGQIEQVILNLGANARDAMPTGGTLTIETANVMLGAEFVSEHAKARPGNHAMIAVSDTGGGMPPEIIKHIFEPFFTTKEVGKGTGLGLATVYGIVSQSAGTIDVESEVGRGTTFRIYLPHVVAEPAQASSEEEESRLARGTETVLVVEDEQGVRRMTMRMLQRLGYVVLEASSGVEAIALCEKRKEPIDLILTDLIMPEMGGYDMAQQARQFRQDFRVLYMSGYTDDIISHHGELAPGTHLLQKPFGIEQLANQLREVLNGDQG